MFALIKELADRFIEFVLRFVGGETIEEQLTSALKSAVFLITILLWATIGTLMANFNLRVELHDMEAGASKMGVLFNSSGEGPLQSFVRINDALTHQLILVKDENSLLYKTNSRLMDENNFLRPYLTRILQDDERIKQNNNILLKMCSPAGLKRN